MLPALRASARDDDDDDEDDDDCSCSPAPLRSMTGGDGCPLRAAPRRLALRAASKDAEGAEKGRSSSSSSLLRSIGARGGCGTGGSSSSESESESAAAPGAPTRCCCCCRRGCRLCKIDCAPPLRAPGGARGCRRRTTGGAGDGEEDGDHPRGSTSGSADASSARMRAVLASIGPGAARARLDEYEEETAGSSVSRRPSGRLRWLGDDDEEEEEEEEPRPAGRASFESPAARGADDDEDEELDAPPAAAAAARALAAASRFAIAAMGTNGSPRSVTSSWLRGTYSLPCGPGGGGGNCLASSTGLLKITGWTGGSWGLASNQKTETGTTSAPSSASRSSRWWPSSK